MPDNATANPAANTAGDAQNQNLTQTTPVTNTDPSVADVQQPAMVSAPVPNTAPNMMNAESPVEPNDQGVGMVDVNQPLDNSQAVANVASEPAADMSMNQIPDPNTLVQDQQVDLNPVGEMQRDQMNEQQLATGNMPEVSVPAAPAPVSTPTAMPNAVTEPVTQAEMPNPFSTTEGNVEILNEANDVAVPSQESIGLAQNNVVDQPILPPEAENVSLDESSSTNEVMPQPAAQMPPVAPVAMDTANTMPVADTQPQMQESLPMAESTPIAGAQMNGLEQIPSTSNSGAPAPLPPISGDQAVATPAMVQSQAATPPAIEQKAVENKPVKAKAQKATSVPPSNKILYVIIFILLIIVIVLTAVVLTSLT